VSRQKKVKADNIDQTEPLSRSRRHIFNAFLNVNSLLS
jgi:hypothetical protein